LTKKKEIEEKDKEISQLTQDIISLKERLNAPGQTSDKKKDETIERQKMEIGHLNEKIQQMKENWDRERQNLEKANGDMMEELIGMKLKYQNEVAERDAGDLRNNKRIKNLLYQIKLYEDQIRNFNDQM
jgi:chromosome segregation ATPase